MDKEKLIDRIKKLLALSQNNPSAEEAAVAAAKAQKLLQKYNLKEEFLKAAQGEEEINPFLKIDIIQIGKNISTWKASLINKICQINEAACWIERANQTKNICLIGEAHTTLAIKHLFLYLVEEIEKICSKQNNNCGKTWANNFKLGAVYIIAKRLEEEKSKNEKEIKKELEELAEKNGMSIVLVSTAIQRRSRIEQKINDYLKTLNLSSKNVKNNINISGWKAGVEAGKKIDLNPNKKLSNGNILKENNKGKQNV